MFEYHLAQFEGFTQERPVYEKKDHQLRQPNLNMN